MHAQTLKAIATLKDLNQSDLAKAAGVSRQRVSQWFQAVDAEGYLNAHVSHVRALATALSIDFSDLMQPLPVLNDPKVAQRETTKLLWDKLYPDLVSLLSAAIDGRRDALARVVQVYGFFVAAKLFGVIVWRDFPRYKIFIKPARRVELEYLWQYRQDQMKN